MRRVGRRLRGRRFQLNAGRQLALHARQHEERVRWIYAVFWHVAVVGGLHMVFHFIGPGKFFATNGAWENFSLLALVVQEGMPLE